MTGPAQRASESGGRSLAIGFGPDTTSARTSAGSDSRGTHTSESARPRSERVGRRDAHGGFDGARGMAREGGVSDGQDERKWGGDGGKESNGSFLLCDGPFCKTYTRARRVRDDM